MHSTRVVFLHWLASGFVGGLSRNERLRLPSVRQAKTRAHKKIPGLPLPVRNPRVSCCCREKKRRPCPPLDRSSRHHPHARFRGGIGSTPVQAKMRRAGPGERRPPFG